MARRKLFARRSQPRPRPAPGPSAAPSPSAASGPKLAGPARLVALAAGIYAAGVVAGGLGTGLDWALGQVTPLPQGLLATVLPIATIFGLSHGAVHQRGWADGTGLLRAGLLVAVLLAAAGGAAAQALGGPPPLALVPLGAWLLVLLAALDHPPGGPGADETTRVPGDPPRPPTAESEEI